MDLTDRHVVVGGAGSGIGRATARLAAERGATLTLSGRTAAKLDATAQGLETAARVLPVDMTSQESVADWAAGLAPVDHLVISASSAIHGPFAESRTEEILGMVTSKFLGPLTCVRKALPKLVAGGSVTLFAGVLSRRPAKGAVALGAVNAAVEALARGLALELGPDLRVNCVSPGMTDTEAHAHLSEARRAAMFADTGGRLPLGRVAEAHEIAQAVLMTMTSTFMTGHVVDVDGGHMVRQ
ncbi:MAG: SDR family oxidoreductase [Shimia sp.]